MQTPTETFGEHPITDQTEIENRILAIDSITSNSLDPVQEFTVEVKAFYKLHPTTTTEGRYEGEDFTFDLIRQDSWKRGDHFDFKLTKIPSDFGFIGLVDADLGNGRYKISKIKAEEYRRMVDNEILQIGVELPFDSQKNVKRLLFGPKSVFNQQIPVLPYAFVSDHILISRTDSADFVECERMLLWFFLKNRDILSSNKFGSLLEYHFERRKKFLYPTQAHLEKFHMRKEEVKELIEYAFSRNSGNLLSKESFMSFWGGYGFALILILKVPTIWGEGRVFGFSQSNEQIEEILKSQSIGSFVMHIPIGSANKLVLSYVKTEIPTTEIESQTWTVDSISETGVVKFIFEKQLRRYFLCRYLWTTTKWGDVKLTSASTTHNTPTTPTPPQYNAIE
jgi:hypothetical protein